MPKTIATIRITDMPEFKAFVEEVNRKVESLDRKVESLDRKVETLVRERNEARREAGEWEERYDWLLGEAGGTAPR